MKARLQAWAEKVQGWLPVRVIMAFGASQASNYASALAFNAILSMFPLILGVLAIVGLSIRDPAAELKVQQFIVQSFPTDSTQQTELLRALHSVKQSAGWLGIVSIAGLLWSASGIFASMEFVFAEIFGIQQRDMIRQKLMGFVMMIVLVAAVALAVGANALAALLPFSSLSWLSSFVIGSLVMMLLLVALYRLVPNRSYQIRHILPGALLAGVLIEALSLAWPLYARISHGFNTYGNAFALFFLLAAWFYLLSNLILLGAVYNKFRLGHPMKEGLIATPEHKARSVPRPADAIEQHKPAADAAPRSGQAKDGRQARRERPALGHRLAGYVVVGLAIFPRLLRRRGSHSIET